MQSAVERTGWSPDASTTTPAHENKNSRDPPPHKEEAGFRAAVVMAAERPGSSSPAAETNHRQPVAPRQSNCGRSSYAGPVKYVKMGTLALFCE